LTKWLGHVLIVSVLSMLAPVSVLHTYQLTSAGKYEANQYLILARYVMSPSQRTLLTLHGEVTNG